MVEPTPTRPSSTSFVDFDPREPASVKHANEPPVTPLGAGEGFRVGDGRLPEYNPRGGKDSVKTL
jgi:hypothetical protein